MICEQHPEMVWPHGDCTGPGCPLSAKDHRQWYLRRELQQRLVALEGMVISGRVRIEELEAALLPMKGRRKLWAYLPPVPFRKAAQFLDGTKWTTMISGVSLGRQWGIFIVWRKPRQE